MEQFYFGMNLNKFGEERLKAQKEKRTYINTWIAFLIIFILIGGFTYWTLTNMDKKINTRKQQLTEIKNEIKKYPQVLKASDSSNLEKDMQTFAETYNKRIFWTKKLQALAEITSDSLAISKFSFENGSWELEGLIKAKTADVPQDIINKYRTSLVEREEFNDFKSVEFVNRDLVKKVESLEAAGPEMDVVYGFTIKCMSKYYDKKRRK